MRSVLAEYFDVLDLVEQQRGAHVRRMLASAVAYGGPAAIDEVLRSLPPALQEAWAGLGLDLETFDCSPACQLQIHSAVEIHGPHQPREGRVVSDVADYQKLVEPLREVIQAHSAASEERAPGSGHGPIHIDELGIAVSAGPAAFDQQWWLPSLCLLAATFGDLPDAATHLLDNFAKARPWLSYAVVEELTDGNAGLTLFEWPIVDATGALTFPADIDPPQVTLPIGALQSLFDQARRWWAEHGLLTDRFGNRAESLEARPVEFGDVIAVRVSLDDDPGGWMQVGAHLHDPELNIDRACVLGGISDWDLPPVDITWDARQAAKLAHFGAAGNVRPEIDEAVGEPGGAVLTDHPPPVSDQADEPDSFEIANTRALLALERRVDPRDIGIDEVIDHLREAR